MGGNGNLLEVKQEVQVWLYKQMVYAQPRICLGEWDTQTSPRLWDTNGSPNLSQTTTPCYSQQKKREAAE